MQHTHTAIRHLRYLRQSLSQDNESIGFFIAAGCPLSVKMADASLWPLIPDVATLTKHLNQVLSSDKRYSILLDIVKQSGKNPENIEHILSFVRSLLVVAIGGEVRGLTEADLKALEKNICAEIVKKIDVSLPDDNTPYHRLGNWIKSIDRKVAVEVFTTNYDLLLEQALETLEIPYFDGFVGSRRSFFDLRAVEDGLAPRHWTRLWKIHGSINWYQETINDQKKVYRSSEVKSDASHLIYPSHLKYEESRKMPYLALIDQLTRFIRKKSSFLIISGYSFSDEHLNDAIVNALKANPTAMVLALLHGSFNRPNGSDAEIEAYPKAYILARNQHNLNIWTDDCAIIGTNAGPWTGITEQEEDDADLRHFIEVISDGSSGHSPKRHVKFGDFGVLTNFLKQIIGTSKEVLNAK